MMKRLGWVIAAMAVFLVAVLAMLPASLLMSMVPAGTALNLEDVRGSVWQGSVGRVSWQEHDLGSLAWQLAPAGLLRGRLEAQVRLTGTLLAEAQVVRRWSAWRITDMKADLPAAWLAPVLASPGVMPQGDIQLRVSQAEWQDGQFSALEGQLHWRNASVSGAAVAALGDVSVDFSRQDDGRIHGRVYDHQGPLSVSGQLLADNSGYRAELQLRARDSRISPALHWLGQPQPDGSRLLVLQGMR